MKQTFAPRKARALAPFLAATALLATPALAQDAPQTAQPVVTPPSTATVPIPPVVRTVPDGTPPAAESAPAATPKAAPRTATRATRTVTRTASTTRTATPVAAAPAPQPAAPAPQPAQPQASAEPAAPPPAAAPASEPVPATNAGTSTSSTTTLASSIPLWGWIAGGIAILAILLGGLFAMRRRRTEDYYYDEPVYAEPEPYVEPAPVAVAPVFEPVPVAKPEPRKEPEYLRRSAPPATPALEPVIAAPDEVHMKSADSDDVAALTAGTHTERPWLEFAMRPVRAGTNIDEALVEIELTVGNAGSIPAKDVRISTFLLSSDPRGSEMERLLVNPPADATTDPVTIKPGEGKRIDATLALLKSEMGEVLPDTIRPIVVADARYTLPDGSEGRTSASFVIGVTPEEGSGLDAIELTRASMHDNVGAELHGEPQHA